MGENIVESAPVPLGNNEYYVAFTLKSGKTTDYKTWTVPANVTQIRYLVVGGGGGGGGGFGGGGGGGGFIEGTLTSGIKASYLVQVASGGTGGNGGTSGAAGGNSIFKLSDETFQKIAYGGGGGGCYRAKGGDGGTGGGAGGTGTTLAIESITSGGTCVYSGQGYAGGSVNNTSQNRCGAGGGGAGAAGQNGGGYTDGDCGNGGAGRSSDITGVPVVYGGGGGGGNYSTGIQRLGGAGGGGAGALGNGAQVGTVGLDGLGGGGGGGAASANGIGGKGGSGIVIVRYTVSGGSPVVAVVVDVDAGTIKQNGVSVGTASKDGNDVVLQFTKTDTPMSWSVPENVTSIRYLAIGGGGAGGSGANGGGGGAGGVLAADSLNVTANSVYTIQVGAAGTGKANTYGANGGHSLFAGAGITVGVAAGGGGGGSHQGNPSNGRDGGSGGGGGSNVVIGGNGISGQGHDGGSGYYGYSGGGGGGAGTQGTSGSGTSCGNGGTGIESDITGSPLQYAGGGGGGGNQSSFSAAGAGSYGGGNGGLRQAGSAATTYGSGGGGGGLVNNFGGSGMQGIVIVRYSEGPVKTALKSVTLSSASCTYDAQSHETAIKGLTLTVKDANNANVAATNYDVAYKRGGSAATDWTSAGAITVAVTAKDASDYSGTVSATYTINAATVTALAVSPTEFTYEAGVSKETSLVSVTAGGKTWTAAQLTENTDYTKSGTWSAEAVNTYTATVTGKGNFTGSASATWMIREYTCPHEHTTESPAVAPTCEQPGCTKKITCDDCHKVLEGGEEIPALGHDWTDWYVTKEPTIDEQGEEARDCKRCQSHETRVLPTIGWTFCPWPDHGYGGTSTTGGTGTYTDGVITNSIGQVLNVYFDGDASGMKLVIGKKKYYGTSNTAPYYCYNGVNPDCTTTNIIDLTGGVKHIDDSDIRYEITTIGERAFCTDCYQGVVPSVTEVITLPPELKTIGKMAFSATWAESHNATSANQSRLKEVRYSGDALETIGDSAFRYCQSLNSSIQSFFPDSLQTLGERAFQYCYSLSGTVNTRNVKVIPQQCFQHCRSLSDFILPHVTEVGTAAFDSFYVNPVKYTFASGSVKLNGQSTFGNPHVFTMVQMLLFPGVPPSVVDEPIVARGSNGSSWNYGKRSYFVIDKNRTGDWLTAGFRTFSSLDDVKGPTTSGLSIDEEVKNVSLDTIRDDLGVASTSDFQIYGVYAPDAKYASYTCVHPIILVAVDPSYFNLSDYVWQNANGGDWSIEGNWSPEGVPDAAHETANFNLHFSAPLTVTAASDYEIADLKFSKSSPVTLDFGGYSLHGSNAEVANLTFGADQTDVTFANGTFAFTNGWFSGKGASGGIDATLAVSNATVTFTGDGNQQAHSGKSYVGPLDFVWRNMESGTAVQQYDTNPNLAISDGGSLTVASPAGVTLSNFMLNSVWGHGVVDGGTLTYANNGSVANTMTFKDGLVVTASGSVTGASKLVLKGGETDIAAGSTVDFTSLSAEGPTKGVIAAAGGTLGVTLTSAATGTDLTFAGITLGDVTGQASQTRLTFANGAVGSGALSYSGKSNCTNVFAGGTFTVPSGKTFALGTTPTLAFVLPETGFASAPLTVQGSGALGNDTIIDIDASQYKGTTYEGGLIPLVKLASAIGNLATLKANATGIPDGMQLAVSPTDSTLLVLAPNGYTVTFNANGGEPQLQYKTFKLGEKYGTFPEVSRQGFKFLGWYTAAEGGTRKYTGDSVLSEHTLYAHWEAARGLILSFGPAPAN